jgi:hypothetical protein
MLAGGMPANQGGAAHVWPAYNGSMVPTAENAGCFGGFTTKLGLILKLSVK